MVPAVYGDAAERAQGVLEIRIKDHREAIDDFNEFKITIEKLLLAPKPGFKFWQTRWQDLGVAPETVDLTKYRGKKSARVFRRAIDAGSFDAFQLKLKMIDAVLKSNRRSAPVKNAVVPVQQSFEVAAKSETILIIDLVVIDLSDHPPRGYELSIGGYEIYTDGKLTKKIPPG